MTSNNYRTQKKARTSITLEEDVLEKIDGERGLVPRSTFINAKFKEDKKDHDSGVGQ